MTTIQEFHKQSIENPDAFWGEEAKRIDWHKPFTQVLDFSRPPFAKWFVGGETNLCYNAIDRHAAKRPNDRALVFISTETDQEVVYTFAELKTEVMRMAAIMQSLGVGKGESKDVQQVCNTTAAPAYLCKRPMFRVTSYGRGRGMGRVVLQANIISQPQ